MAKQRDLYDEVIEYTAQPITDRNTLTLTERQMQRGICSDANCHRPIDGWCITCRAKLCHDHLHEHLNLHARERAHASLQRGESTYGG